MPVSTKRLVSAFLALPASLVVLGGGCTNDPPPSTPTTPTPVASTPAPSPTPSVSASASAPAAPKVCLPARTGEGSLLRLVAVGNRALVCFLDQSLTPDPYASPGQSHPCLSVDPETGDVATAEPYKIPDGVMAGSPAAATVETTTSTVKVCPVGDKAKCKTLTIPGQVTKVAKKPAPKKGKGKKAAPPVEPPSDDPKIAAFADPTGARVFVFVRDKDKKGAFQLQGDLYDVATGKRLSRTLLTTAVAGTEVPAFADPSNNWSGQFIGDRLVLTDTVCCGPGGASWLVDPAKGKLAYLHGYGGTLGQDPTSKVWLTLHGKSLSAVDLTAMTVTPIATAPGNVLDPEATSAEWLSVGGKVVLFYGAAPGYVVVDPVARKASAPHPLPLCAAP